MLPNVPQNKNRRESLGMNHLHRAARHVRSPLGRTRRCGCGTFLRRGATSIRWHLPSSAARKIRLDILGLAVLLNPAGWFIDTVRNELVRTGVWFQDVSMA